MPQPTGKFIDSDSIGKSDVGASALGSSASAGVPNSAVGEGREFIRGTADPEGGDTIKLTSGPTVGPRRTKDGRVDGRTRAARSGGDNGDSSSTGTPAKGTPTLEKLSVKELLMDIHAMGAALLDIQEFDLSEEEGTRYSQRIENVMRLYPNKVINQKALAWSALIATMGGIYGPRYATYKLRTQMEKKEKPAIHVVQSQPSPAAPQTQAAQPAKSNGHAASYPESEFPTPSMFWPESAEV